MSLVNPSAMIRSAFRAGRAVPAFNVDSPDMMAAVVRAASPSKRAIMVQCTQETLAVWGARALVGWLRHLTDEQDLEVGLVLDHVKAVDPVSQALQAGFTGVMYDGSMLPVAENIAATQAVVALARSHHAYVEGEIGHVGRDGEPQEWEQLTDPAAAREFYAQTGVDALAIAIGTQHGHYRGPERIDLARLEATHRLDPDLPLVLHGGSGVPDAMLPDLARRGMAKMNFGNQLRRLWWAALQEATDTTPRVALARAMHAIELYAGDRMNLLDPKE